VAAAGICIGGVAADVVAARALPGVLRPVGIAARGAELVVLASDGVLTVLARGY